jgi:hypothetical protein
MFATAFGHREVIQQLFSYPKVNLNIKVTSLFLSLQNKKKLTETKQTNNQITRTKKEKRRWKFYSCMSPQTPVSELKRIKFWICLKSSKVEFFFCFGNFSSELSHQIAVSELTRIKFWNFLKL